MQITSLTRWMRQVTADNDLTWRDFLLLWKGYVAALLGTAVVTLSIRLSATIIHIDNISLLYLIVVIGIAALFSRGPAIAAAVLAFLAYDYFCIPPIYQWTVNDPAEYVSLAALLLAGLVTGQLATRLRQREQGAVENAERIHALYTLAQAAATNPDPAQVSVTVLRQLVQIFAPQGLLSVVLYQPTDAGTLAVTGVAHAPTEATARFPVDEAFCLAQAERAWQAQGAITLAMPSARPLPDHWPYGKFLTLQSGGHLVGVLGIIGTEALQPLTDPDHPDPLFAACRDQLAFAIEHELLLQEAIHVAALRESDRLKTALLGSVTHDLRTPLAAIAAVAESGLQRHPQVPLDQLRDMWSQVQTSTQRLSRLVDNLLALSRLEAQVDQLHTEWYPIADVFATVLEQMDKAGITDERTIEMQTAPEVLLVPMDHAQIERVVMNILENAVKYSPPGTPITITIATSEPDTVQVRITDQGIGIPASELTAIFSKFYRLQSTLPWAIVTPPSGTGLGLAICAGIIAEHGGQMWAESVVGVGATFVFTLPCPALAAWDIQQDEEMVAP